MPQVSRRAARVQGHARLGVHPDRQAGPREFPAAPAARRRRAAACSRPRARRRRPTSEPTSDGPIVAPLRVALERHAEVVGRHFGTVVRPGYFANANADQWTDGTLVYVPRNVKVDAPILITTVQDSPARRCTTAR